MQDSQNDIKKLRRENEQLRREIWSLRDEYDKLEEILKRQKGRTESEEYEDRSEDDEDDGLQSDYSFEEDEEVDQYAEEEPKERTKSEQLENAENQKISTEKMTSNSLHRLHVDFDDLSVVDEEEEPKKDKEKKAISTEDVQQAKEDKAPPSILKSRQLHENIPFYPGRYQPPSCVSSPTYYTECPFKFPSTLNLMLPPNSSTVLASPCPGLNADPLVPVPGLDGLNVDEVHDQILHAPPAGWQNELITPQTPATTFGVASVNNSLSMQNFGLYEDQMKQQSLGPAIPGFPSFPSFQSFLQSRNTDVNTSGNPFDSVQNPEKMVVENGWAVNAELKDAKDLGASDVQKTEAEDNPLLTGAEKPKHFFAPLPSKLRKPSEEPSPTISQFGTGTSSSSGKTGSTVVSKNFLTQKGSADVYVNGAIPQEGSFQRGKTEQRTFLSTDNLLINDVRTGNQLTKSMSCQDLHSEPQAASEGKQQMMTKSDNTLDSMSISKPYKSHLSVTLKTPRVKQALSPDTPEIPKLPTMDYRLFNNPFLRSFDPSTSYVNQNHVTRPLSVQVNDDNLCYYSPEVPTFKGVPFRDRYKIAKSDQNRLLIPSNQLINGKLVSPTNKHQIQVTSFERPSPHTLIGPSSTSPYEFNTLRRLNPYLQNQNVYQNMPFVPRGGLYPQRGMMYYDNLTLKVPAQTQTSLDGDSHHEDEHMLSHEESAPSTPSGQRRKKLVRKEKMGTLKEQRPLSPVAQRRLKKQSSVTSSEVPESPGKVVRKKPRRFSITTTTSEGQEDKNDSRSSSSGQDSPKKDQTRRVSLYFNTKKRPSLSSLKTTRSGSLDMGGEKNAMGGNLERERTNSVSSREIGNAKARKASTSSGSVPWCACWGNGCV